MNSLENEWITIFAGATSAMFVYVNAANKYMASSTQYNQYMLVYKYTHTKLTTVFKIQFSHCIAHV